MKLSHATLLFGGLLVLGLSLAFPNLVLLWLMLSLLWHTGEKAAAQAIVHTLKHYASDTEPNVDEAHQKKWRLAPRLYLNKFRGNGILSSHVLGVVLEGSFIEVCEHFMTVRYTGRLLRGAESRVSLFKNKPVWVLTYE